MLTPFGLALNAAAQMLVASLLGFAMLVPMQPWGRGLAARFDSRALRAAHLDWIMLALVQQGVAFTLEHWPVRHVDMITALLMFGGWVNPLAYLFRAFGINAFVLSWRPRQLGAALLVGASAVSLLAGFLLLVIGLLAR